jgi:hypothetical protein
VAELKTVIETHETELAKCRKELAERDLEMADRQSLRGEIGKLQQALKNSLELYTLQANAMASMSGRPADAAGAEAIKYQLLASQHQQLQAELVQVKGQMNSATTAAERSKAAETSLRSDLEIANKHRADLKAELAVLRLGGAGGNGSATVAGVSTSDVMAHPEYQRLLASHSNAQRELERSRAVEAQLREQMAQMAQVQSQPGGR